MHDLQQQATGETSAGPWIQAGSLEGALTYLAPEAAVLLRADTTNPVRTGSWGEPTAGSVHSTFSSPALAVGSVE